VLVDHSRVRNSKKRLTDYQLVETLPSAFAASRATESLLAIRALMAKLALLDPTAAETMRLRYVVGQTLEEIARIQGREAWRVRDDLRFATKWLVDRY
jgi:DNA-directed RNA polymerase specialized sigma24 family protein